jgi:uncharacterized Zn-binding protein involved in type VI secretion
MQTSIDSYTAIYKPAMLGAKTAKGGTVVTVTSGCTSDGVAEARIGDTVRYPDGTESVITSGCGFASMSDNLPIAIVGSHVQGGDYIVSSPESGMALHIDERNRPAGFLVEGWKHQGA